MIKTPSLTKQDIFGAADSLAARGIMPTIMGIRGELGERGSETTLQKFLKDWKDQLLKRYNDVASVPVATLRDCSILQELKRDILQMLEG